MSLEKHGTDDVNTWLHVAALHAYNAIFGDITIYVLVSKYTYFRSISKLAIV